MDKKAAGRGLPALPRIISCIGLLPACVSALFLGVYELCTKHAVRDNAVVPVLFFSTLTGAAVWVGLLMVQMVHPGTLPASLVTDPLTLAQHLQLVLKSAIVAASWVFTYFALKHLPLSLGSPIRATSPLWTLFGAILILGERPTWLETVGVLTTLASFVGLSFAGRLEGVHFHRNKWVGFLIAGTLLGAVSSLYDKYLLGRVHFSVPTVQAWFSIYLVRPLHAVRHRLEAALVAAQRIPLALEHSVHRAFRCWWPITFISAPCAIPPRSSRW